VRREVVIGIQVNDLLGIRSEKSESILQILLKQTQQIKEYTTRFINALASDFLGRTYLLESDKVIHLLIELLKSEVFIPILLYQL
jgi:predicted thioredoxin/glutaredoxin